MKILHLISSGGLYGAEAVILHLSCVLRQQGHESSLGVLTTTSEGHLQLYEEAMRQGIASHLIQCSGALDVTVLKRIRALIVSTGAEVVHMHGYKADVYGFLAVRGSKVALVSTCHTWYDNGISLRLYGMLDRIVLGRFMRVAAVSDEVRQQLLHAGVSFEKIRLIHNGIDPSLFAHSIPSLTAMGRPLIGLVGRLAKEKGVDLFIRAAEGVLRRFPDAHFVIIGEGPDHPMLEALIGELRLQREVKLLGRRDDMAALYASMTVLVSASRQEGMPVTILEAMASGLAIVATDAGEVSILITDNHTGLLVPLQSTEEATVQALSAAIVKLIVDEATRIRLGAAARDRVTERFSARAMTANYLALYQEALAEGSAS